MPENPADPSSNTLNPASTSPNPIQSPTPAVNSSQMDNVPKKPISTGIHLSKDPKIADGSAIGKEIKKQKIKEAKEKSKNKTPKEEEVIESGLDLNNNCTLSNETDCEEVVKETTISPVVMTTTTTKPTTTTTKKTTVAMTTTSTPMTTTVPKSTTRLANENAVPIMSETGNDTVAMVSPPAEDSSNHTEGTMKKTYHKIIKYVNQVTS